MPEVVGDAALLFDPLDAAAMADRILQVLRDRALARSLAERGIARARRFSWERTAQLTADVLVSTARPTTIARTVDGGAISRPSPPG